MAEVIETDQAETQPEENVEVIQAGQEGAVETATTETDAGLLEKKSGFSAEDIMSEGESEVSDVLDEDPHGVKKRISKLSNKAKLAEDRATAAEKRVAEMESISSAPTQRPQVPVRENYETAEEYQADFIKYEDNTVAFNNSQQAINIQKEVSGKQRQVAEDRFNSRAGRMREKFPDFDKLVTTDNADGSNPFGNVADIVLASEYNAEVAYLLRRDPIKLEEIQGMSRNDALMEIGALSGKFKAVPKTKTNAPQALNTIKEGSDTPVVNLYDIKDPNEFLRKKNEEILRKRKQGG